MRALKILVVDDVADIAGLICVALRRAGHSAIGATSVDGARKAIGDDGPFDLVLTDMRMAPGTGVDVLRACVQQASPVPVMLVMTGYANPALLAEAMELGVLGVLRKPFRMHQVVDAVTFAAQGAPETLPAPSILQLVNRR